MREMSEEKVRLMNKKVDFSIFNVCTINIPYLLIRLIFMCSPSQFSDINANMLPAIPSLILQRRVVKDI